jgi:hypothetical protein
VAGWLAGWVWTCAWIWTYRRQVPALVASVDPYTHDGRQIAARHAAVAMHFTVNDLTGLDLHGLTPTPAARFMNGQWPLVGHVAAVGLCIIAASIG